MMMNKRLINLVSQSKKYIALNVFMQWLSLLANIALMSEVAYFFKRLYEESVDEKLVISLILLSATVIVIKALLSVLSSKMSYLSSKAVKEVLREKIYTKLLSLGSSYKDDVQTSEVVQVAVEGVDQLETYFGSYLPQLFYSLLAPLTLFIILSLVSFPVSIVLFICVPLIPITIVFVQRWAKKLLSRYWDQYTTLGDTFLENLQGLTTSKIYQADEVKHKEMNEMSERFRKITMKVLTMQLNSITVMDLIAYGGAALGIILGALQFYNGKVSLMGALLIILLSADFFLPMRLLGSYFHIAMNGMAASQKIFRLLDLEEGEKGTEVITDDTNIKISDLSFSYTPEVPVLYNVNMSFPKGSFTALVGKSGCGKSTIAALLMGRKRDYTGAITIGGIPLSSLKEESVLKHITYINHQSYIFKGSVRENLLMGCEKANDAELWRVLEKVNLGMFFKREGGLDFPLLENGLNLSGGQRQRLSIARALLHNSEVYIFDEATSNIDVESENDIISLIYELAKTKTVILISHRLLNVVSADNIYVLDSGSVVESGKHHELLNKKGRYHALWHSQQELEMYAKGGVAV